MRVLVVEDDETIAEPLCTGLRREGFDVRHAASGQAALAAEPADLVLLDLGLPDLDGRVVCRELRERSGVPIIVVSARGDEIDRVILLELGADDYVVKPFGFRELVARIRAVLRRTGSDRAAPLDTIDVGGLHVDRRSRAVNRRRSTAHADPEGVRPPPPPRRGPRRRLHPRADHGGGLGRELVGFDEDPRRPHRITPQEARRRLDRDRARVGFVLHDPGDP